MERQIATQPIPIPRTRRRDAWRGLTSCKAGSIVPVAFFPMLREDAARGQVAIQVKMFEALHTIINPIRIVAQVHLVPKVALSRFEGSMETLNRSWGGQTLPGGGVAPSWFVQDTSVAGSGTDDFGHEIYDALGVHYTQTSILNSDLLESYWTMVNWRRRSVSSALADMPLTGSVLSPAFWNEPKFDFIKPSFDAAMMEGAVELTPLPGGVERQAGVFAVPEGNAGSTPGLATNTALTTKALSASTQGANRIRVEDADGTQGGLFAFYSDATGGMVSLANIDMARKAQAMAQMRQRYEGIPDEYLVEQLMQGIRVPPEDLKEPILLDRSVAIINQAEQYATDGDNLSVSVTRGIATLSLSFAVPPVNTGGIILVSLEIVPEQLYERVEDHYLSSMVVDDLPDALADMLDPQKVEVVPNRHADVFHSAPDAVFGYAPLNYGWQREINRVGGRYKRPVPDAFKEDRQRIWSVEKADPTLSDDFYLCPQPFPHTVFADAAADPFEVMTVGQVVLTGLTQFGGVFEEDGDHYEKIMAQIDATRIESVPPAATAAADEPATNEAEVQA